MDEFKSQTEKERVDCLLAFWTKVKDINGDTFGLVNLRTIGQGIIEIVMGDALYSCDVRLPASTLVDYGIEKMKEYKIPNMYIEKLQSAFQRNK